MSDLTEFLLARLAEDEAEARSLASHPDTDMRRVRVVLARVLAECEAKRRIVAQEREAWAEVGSKDGSADVGLEFSVWMSLSDSVRHLAAVCADHPDYRAEWKP